MVKINQSIIKKGQTKQRPGGKMTPKYITVHNTANRNKGANAALHARYLHNGAGGRAVGWHFTVDDKEIYQHLPLNEHGWHAGDGAKGKGNLQSIGIEVCENSDGNHDKAMQNAQWLIRKLMSDHNISINNVVPHKHWSGKNCPNRILPIWDKFIDGLKEQPKSDNLYKVQIGAYKQKVNADLQAKRAKEKGFDTYILHEKGLYKVQIGAYASKKNAEAQADKAKKAGFEVYIENAKQSTSSTPKQKPAPKPTPKQKTFKVGQKVKIKSAAKTYSRSSVSIPSKYKNKTYTIQQVAKDDVLIKELVSWVRKADLQ